MCSDLNFFNAMIPKISLLALAFLISSCSEEKQTKSDRFKEIEIAVSDLGKTFQFEDNDVLVWVKASRGTLPSYTKLVCVVLLGEDQIGSSEAEFSRQLRKSQVTPRFYRMKLKGGGSYMSSFIKEVRGDRNYMQLVYDEGVHKDMVLELFFEDLDGDSKREDVTLVLNLEGFDWDQ